MMRFSKKATCVVAICLALAYSDRADAGVWQELKETKWEDGRLRLEGQVWTGTRSGGRSRTGDDAIAGTIEKEFPLSKKLSVGLRAIPLFYIDEDDHGDHEGNDIWGAGLGVSIRYYTQEVQDGWFIEYYESLVGQSEKFDGNTGSANFMSEIGVGYEFDNDWHLAAKWRHLSNAGIANRNSGFNSVGIGFGFSF